MLVPKGTQCKTLCCNRAYRSQIEFTPKQEPLICNGTVYVRGNCFKCLFTKDILPSLKAYGIVAAPESRGRT